MRFSCLVPRFTDGKYLPSWSIIVPYIRRGSPWVVIQLFICIIQYYYWRGLSFHLPDFVVSGTNGVAASWLSITLLWLISGFSPPDLYSISHQLKQSANQNPHPYQLRSIPCRILDNSPLLIPKVLLHSAVDRKYSCSPLTVWYAITDRGAN